MVSVSLEATGVRSQLPPPTSSSSSRRGPAACLLSAVSKSPHKAQRWSFSHWHPSSSAHSTLPSLRTHRPDSLSRYTGWKSETIWFFKAGCLQSSLWRCSPLKCWVKNSFYTENTDKKASDIQQIKRDLLNQSCQDANIKSRLLFYISTTVKWGLFWGEAQTFPHSVSGYKHRLALKYKWCRPEAGCCLHDSLFEEEVVQSQIEKSTFYFFMLASSNVDADIDTFSGQTLLEEEEQEWGGGLSPGSTWELNVWSEDGGGATWDFSEIDTMKLISGNP